MTGYRGVAATLSLFLCTLTGCVAALQNSPLPDGLALRNIAQADAGEPFAVNGTGVAAAMTKGTLQVIDLSVGTGRILAPAPASALCFSPGGQRLAAAFATNGKSLLQIFDLKGKLLAELVVPGRVTSLAWRSEQELLAAAVTLKKYSFGTELAGLLYRWDGAAPPVVTTLNNVTVRPQIASLPEEILYRSLSLAVSPYGDEIAYSFLKDPPVFAPYLRIAVRHIESGAEREVAQSPVDSRGLLYAPDGESLLVGEARGMSRRLSLPDGREIDAWPVPGNNAALSPSGSYAFLDGRLYQGGRNLVWLPEATGAFLPDGSGLIISQSGKLSIVTGLNEARRPVPTGNLDQILELRRQRMLGLITEKEFKSQKKRVPAI